MVKSTIFIAREKERQESTKKELIEDIMMSEMMPSHLNARAFGARYRNVLRALIC